MTPLTALENAQQFMPKVREWMNSHIWLVNIIVCVVFIVLILARESSSITWHGVRASRQAT
jgi:hypothetical protein